MLEGVTWGDVTLGLGCRSLDTVAMGSCRQPDPALLGACRAQVEVSSLMKSSPHLSKPLKGSWHVLLPAHL